MEGTLEKSDDGHGSHLHLAQRRAPDSPSDESLESSSNDCRPHDKEVGRCTPQAEFKSMPATIEDSKSSRRNSQDSDPIAPVTEAPDHFTSPQPRKSSQIMNSDTPGLEEDTNQISLREVAPVDVNVQHLSVVVETGPAGFAALLPFGKSKKQSPSTKTILNDVTARMPSGSLTAIIGASGSGKTSMLNVMSQRLSSSRLKQTGDTFFNGSPRLSSVRSAYVMQQDVLLPTLTVRETLQYSADLRIPPPTTAEERRLIVEEIILELGLKECADTRIGNSEYRGCSGGEKRRTSLGVQLLANPSVLFLDEVTTGLDAASAFQLVRTLKMLARKGRTIIITIHQPRSEIWGLFDNLVLLSGGSPIYTGPADAAIQYFVAYGHALPPFVNPAEHLIDLAAIDKRSPELEDTSVARVEGLKQKWRSSPECAKNSEISEKSMADVNGSAAVQSSRRSVFTRQVRVQTLRTLKTTLRDPLGVMGSYIEVFAMAIITGWIFYQLDGSLSGIRSREGALYTAAALQGYLILLYEVYRMTLDIALFDREYSEGVVTPLSFLVSRRLARAFTEDVPIPLIFSIIFYFMVGFRHNASQFFTFYVVTLLGQFIAVTLATLCVAISRDLAGATLVANMNFTLQSVCSKFFFLLRSISGVDQR
jgi:ABC-type multidrug transport system ATPase subunit